MGNPHVHGQADAVTALVVSRRRPLRILERNGLAYRRMWPVFLTGLLEPVFFLASIGIGVGGLVGKLPSDGGRLVSYQSFVGPGLLAVSAMNGSVLDTTFNFFVKYKYAHTYDAMLATPLGVRDIAVGEVMWALVRGTFYSGAFLAVMGIGRITTSWWALLALPGACLIAFAFAGAGLAATTWMRSFMDFDFVNLVIIPSFLFSATFFPLSSYPGYLSFVVRLTPLYQGVAFERSACLGQLSWVMAAHALYLGALGLVGLGVATHRLGRLLQP
jgi:lipooligosaccharide transport system permease protein